MSTLPKICGREDIPALFNAMGLLGSGVEVGVQAGGFSSTLRSCWHGELLYLVDRWRHDPGYIDTANVDQDEQERLYRDVQEMFANDDTVHIIREGSCAAAQLFDDESLDWIYLDADHSYAAVVADLAAWWPKLKEGGVFSGHDYVDGVLLDSDFGVKSAVDQFAQGHGLQIFTTREDPIFMSWYCQKPPGAKKIQVTNRPS